MYDEILEEVLNHNWLSIYDEVSIEEYNSIDVKEEILNGELYE